MSVGEPRPERSKTHDTILLYRPIQKQCTQIQLKEYFFIFQLHANSNAGFGKLIGSINNIAVCFFRLITSLADGGLGLLHFGGKPFC